MTQDLGSEDLGAVWQGALNELTTLAGQPDSGIPALRHLERTLLFMATPDLHVNGYLILKTHNQRAKQFIETDFAPYIKEVVGRHLGEPVQLLVNLVEGEDPAPQPRAEPAAQSPAQDSGADEAPAAPERRRAPAQPTVEQPRPERRSQQQGSAFEQQRQRIREAPPKQQRWDESKLNPDYTFDTFVIGSSNRFANSAAVAVAENPARAYNPLFISGGSGLGKTHLLHAAGNYAKELNPDLRILYVSSEEFTNDYINSVRDDKQESFKARYRNLDVLMVDDIQFLQGKEGTQEEFFHTFNALHQAKKQIILSSDRPPKELTTLEERLRTRFQAGLITDIQPPDLETRIAILMKKAESDNIELDRDALELIASMSGSSIRELEGALIRVSATFHFDKDRPAGPIDAATAAATLRSMGSEAQTEITPQAIIEITAERFDLPVEKIVGSGRTKAVAHGRQLAMYLCRELTELSLPKIGEQFGGKDHTTVMYAVNKIRTEMTENRATYNEIQELTQTIKSRSQV